jgi:hypothetical protein
MKQIGTCVITRNEDVDKLEFDWGVIHMLSEESSSARPVSALDMSS